MNSFNRHAASSARGWWIVILLSLLVIMSMIDRTGITVVAQPLMQDLGLTDRDLGLLIGVAFAVVYGLAAYPVAHLIDHGQRIRLVGYAAVVWGGSSVAAGFTTGFLSLAACRGILAIAEAIMMPAALSLIPDLFPVQKRVFPLAIFSAMPPLSLPIALLAGGLALNIGDYAEPVIALSPWRTALCVLGLPSIFLGLLMLATCREPARSKADDRSSDDLPPGGLRHFVDEWRAYGGHLLALAAAASAFLGSAIWLPTALTRAFEVDPAYAGKMLGAFTLPATLAGTILWPTFVNRLELRGVTSARGAALIGISIALLLLGITLSRQSFFGTIVIFSIMSFLYGGVPTFVSQNLMSLAPPHLRGRAATVITFGGGVIATGVGPLLIAEVGQGMPGEGGSALLVAISYVWAGLGVVAAIGFALGFDRIQWAAKRDLGAIAKQRLNS